MGNARIIIECIATEESLRKGATARELAEVEQFSAESRRCEVLAWRTIVRRELGQEVNIFYDEYGAPKVNNPDTHISVSHSREFVAVVIADAPCAIDIESAERNFRKISSRYLSEYEQALAEQYDIFAEMWSAKEALYKYHSKGELDLVQHIVITDYRATEGVLIASILGGAPIEVSTYRQEQLVVAVVQ